MVSSSAASEPALALHEVRAAIDALDEEIVELLAQREGLVRRAAGLKSSASQVAAPKRAERVVQRAADLAAEKGGDPQAVRDIYSAIVSSFIALEMRAHQASG